MPEPSIADIVHRARQGDQDAFRELLARHQTRIFRLARNILAHEEEARDLTQEAFLRAFRKLDRFDTRRNFGAWLTRIAVNLCIDYLRRRKRGEETSVADPAQFGATRDDPAVSLEMRELRGDIDAILRAMPAAYRTALVLREVEGFDNAALGRILGVSATTVRWRLHKGRRLFRDAWLKSQRQAPPGREARR